MKRFELLVGICCLTMLGYLAWQAERGSRGFGYQERLSIQVKNLSGDFDLIKDQHKLLERRVAELRPEAIDPDLLDEMARKNLNFAAPSEMIIHLSN